mgnify:CR=1 FL=1
MSNRSWGSHSGTSHNNEKSVPKQLIKDLTSEQKTICKKRHKKKRRQYERDNYGHNKTSDSDEN